MSMASLLLIPLLLLAATAATALKNTVTPGPGCQESCGGVDIPYPFGIGTGCFHKGFEIICVNNMPMLATKQDIQLQVLNLTVMPQPEARVMLPVAWQCYDKAGDITGNRSLAVVDVNPDGVYRISGADNELYVLGCNTLAYTKNGHGGRFDYAYYSGCMAYTNDSSSAQDGECAGVGCCHVDIPPGLTGNVMTFKNDNTTWSHTNQEYCPCDYAFIVERGTYTFRASDLTNMPKTQTMPLRLDWAIRDNGTQSISCAQAKLDTNKPDYACVSVHSTCFNATNGPGYACICTDGYEGNPYVVDGCIDINECERQYPCRGLCKNTEGSYECKCPSGYHSDDPFKDPCSLKFPLAAKIGIGITVSIAGLIIILLVTWLSLKQIELNAKERELKDMLQNVKTLKVFQKEELEKITRNYSEYLGEGSFGKVHKGILPDNTEVAVKSTIKVTEHTRGEFVKEVEILSRMMHKNVLKLLGCCLQVDAKLVYEFAAKGSLQDILHGKENHPPEPLPLISRLNIKFGSAQGLAYMHSYTEHGIQHADVKPGNILLDGGLQPKLSDFGLSTMFTADKKYTRHVVGCLAYMDPDSIISQRLTPKSDVYSFGAVLLELICRKPIEYGENGSLIKEFKRVYAEEKSGRKLFDNEISEEEDIFILEEIGILAIKCFKENVKERPAMATVASTLVILKDTWEEKWQRSSSGSRN